MATTAAAALGTPSSTSLPCMPAIVLVQALYSDAFETVFNATQHFLKSLSIVVEGTAATSLCRCAPAGRPLFFPLSLSLSSFLR